MRCSVEAKAEGTSEKEVRGGETNSITARREEAVHESRSTRSNTHMAREKEVEVRIAFRPACFHTRYSEKRETTGPLKEKEAKGGELLSRMVCYFIFTCPKFSRSTVQCVLRQKEENLFLAG